MINVHYFTDSFEKHILNSLTASMNQNKMKFPEKNKYIVTSTIKNLTVSQFSTKSAAQLLTSRIF